MASIYETEIELNLVGGAAAGLGDIVGKLLGLSGGAREAENALKKMVGAGGDFTAQAGLMKQAMDAVGIAALGVAEKAIGEKMVGALNKAIDAAKELARLHNTMAQDGWGAQIPAMDDMARQLSGRYRNLSVTELSHGMLDATPIFGDANKAISEFGPMAEFMSTLKAKYGADQATEINRQVQAAIKQAEESGAMKPEDVAGFLKNEEKMLFAFGDQITPSQMLTVQRNLGAYQKDLDDHFRFGILPAMAINQGQRAGTELAMSATKFVAGIRNSSTALDTMLDLGLVQHDDLEFDSKGVPLRLKIGHKTALTDDMDKDPLLAVTKDLLPSILEKYGNDPIVMRQVIGRLAGDKSAISGITDLAINAQRYEKDAANVEKVDPNFERYRQNSPDFAAQSVKAQKENIETAVGLPAVGPWSEVLKLFAAGENKIADAAMRHPELTSFATGVMGIGGAALQFAGVITELYAGYKIMALIKEMKAGASAMKTEAEGALKTAEGAAKPVAKGWFGEIGDALKSGARGAATDLGSLGMLFAWATQSDVGLSKQQKDAIHKLQSGADAHAQIGEDRASRARRSDYIDPSTAKQLGLIPSFDGLPAGFHKTAFIEGGGTAGSGSALLEDAIFHGTLHALTAFMDREKGFGDASSFAGGITNAAYTTYGDGGSDAGGSGAGPLSGGNTAGPARDVYSALKGNAALKERMDFIRQEAAKLGIDPEQALRVAASEGLNKFVGDKGTSFGDFQLHVKNNIPGLSLGGLGDDFRKQTGLDPSDPANWRQMDQFALSYAAKHGWGAWHGWHGSAWAGISRNGSPAAAGASVPGHIGGMLKIGDENFRFGSGGAGGASSVPFGDYPITPGTVGAWGASHGALGLNNNRIFDQALGRMRDGIELHAGHTADLITHGCIAFAADQFAHVKDKILGMIRDKGHAYLHVGKDDARITAERSPFATAPMANAPPVTKPASRGVSGTLGEPGMISAMANIPPIILEHHSHTHLDGRKIAKSVTRHQVDMASVSTSNGGMDPRAMYAGGAVPLTDAV